VDPSGRGAGQAGLPTSQEPPASPAAAPAAAIADKALAGLHASRKLIENLLPTSRARMVGWYDPKVLAQTAWLMTLANIFGRHSDSRLIEALASQPQREFALTSEAQDGEFWLDYVSDVADGWNPTFAVASAIAEERLDVAAPNGELVATRGGQVLVFGGDEVYPYPSKAAYETRTEAPYEAAFEGAGRRPQVFAIPGNHDWYDSLVAFSRTFCRPERGFAGCRTQQTRSYFALQLPHDWWLLAIDLQLGADLDEPQVRYFREVAARMPPQARVILCVPDPQWIYEAGYPDHSSYSDGALRYVQERVLQRRVAVFLTGDLHFYKRHEREDGVQKIVSGGGGAFLHPTHAPRTDRLPGGFVERASYPDPGTSRRLTWWNLVFPFLNPRYLPIPAVLYMMSAWFASATFTPADVGSLRSALNAALEGAIRDPINGLWLILFVSAFVFFTDTHMRWYRVLGGIAHALAHLAAAFFLGWLALVATTQWLGLPFGGILQMLASAAITFFGGGIAGSVVLGLYLFVSLRVFGRHSNEAFSSLRIQDYKQWVRMRIDAAGELTIFALGIDRVPRRWSEHRSGGRSRVQASDPAATPARLIEWLTLRPLAGGGFAVRGLDQHGRRYSRDPPPG
jgi:hypothetical protein